MIIVDSSSCYSRRTVSEARPNGIAAPTRPRNAHVRSILRRQNGIKIVKFGESMDAPGYEYIWRHYRAAESATKGPPLRRRRRTDLPSPGTDAAPGRAEPVPPARKKRHSF